MKRKKLTYLILQLFTLLVYFTMTTVMFFFSMIQGNEGVTFALFGGKDDGFFYWEQAQNVANGYPWIRTSIYPLIAGTLMKVTGIEHVFLIRLFTFLGFILLVWASLNLVKLQFQSENHISSQKNIYNAKIFLLISFLCYASLQMNNLSIYRDNWIYFLYILSVFLSIKVVFHNKNRGLYCILLFLSLWLLSEFRHYAMVSFLLSIGTYFIFLKARVIKNPKRLVVLGSAVFFIYYSFFIDFTFLDVSLRSALNYRAESIDINSGGSQMSIILDQSNVILFMFNYLHSYIGNLIGPLPWHISGISTLFVFIVETIPMVLILIFLWKERTLLTSIQKYILSHGLLWIGVIGFTNDNLGTAARLRPVGWILILIVFVSVFSKNKSLKNEVAS